MTPGRTASLSRLVPTRRRFVQGVAAGGLSLGAGPLRRALAAGSRPVLSGTEFALEIGTMPINITGRPRIATAVNGRVPAPILHWREGDTVTLAVTNRLSVPSSIHWHGVRTPSPMDGVPGLSFSGIAPGGTYVYRFPVDQSGTYWYHSHSAFQEQTGLYGPIIIEPRGGYAQGFDRDYVVMLSDWSDENPDEIVNNLKFQSDYYNFHQRTVGTFFKDVAKNGLAEAVSDRLMWGKMRMSPTDILDVSGATYTYLINGRPPAANWTALFRPGERVRLRFINGSSMSIFDVRIPGLPMTVIQADGNDVEPVTVDEFRISVAETYDAIVRPMADRAYTIFAQAEDRTGFARGTLAPHPGMAAPIPPMDPRPLRTMVDMGMGGMAHGSMSGMPMGHGAMPGMGHDSMQGMPMDQGAMPGMSHGSMPEMPMGHGTMPGMKHGSMQGMPMDRGTMPSMNHGSMSGMPMNRGAVPGMNHGSAQGMPMDHGAMPGMAASPAAKRLQGTVGVDNIAEMPTERLNRAGEDIPPGRRVLTYADLRATRPGSDPRPPSRDITFHLTGNMERFIWGMDGKKFSEAEPIVLQRGERVRFVLINDTMMEHPMHLHGLWSELENGYGAFRPYKHTINVKPGERLSFLVNADHPGRWAFHCHLLYHMEAGMFREVRVL
ncbi:MAG TPA: copper resistance system multicopper oxidase [Stellaceae bacterium]|nr:copper resistance system multicopper oxidase [Stellaceae bacterium]